MSIRTTRSPSRTKVIVHGRGGPRGHRHFARRQRHPYDSVSLGFQFALYSVIEMAKENAQAFASSETERGYQVAIARDCYQGLNRSTQREARKIKSDAKIDAFLIDIWY